MTVNRVVYGKPLNRVDVFDKFEAHRTSYSSVPKVRNEIHEELRETNTAESVSTMNHNSRNVDMYIIVYLT